MRYLIILVTLVVASSCASTGKFQENLNAWMGHPSRELASVWGVPQATMKLADGSELWEYSRTGATQGYAYRNQLTGAVQATAATAWCKTTFTISPEGQIVYAAWEGNACRSE